MKRERPTIKDVAKEAGVSIATVSRFLNNPRIVKVSKREAIRAAINKLNYKPDLTARKLAGGQLNTIGLIIPGYEGVFNSFYGMEIIRSLGEVLENTNYDLLIHLFWGKDRLQSALVDGVIFADIIGNEGQFLRIIREKIPCVVINRKISEYKVSYVAIDNFRGAYEAVNFLIHQGHRIIAHIGGDLRTECGKERLEGYKSALINNNLEVDSKYIKICNFSPLLVKNALEELFILKNRPTAIFCASDDMALEVLNFAENRKISVPKELSIIGFDDNPRTQSANVYLSTVRQPLKRMVEIAWDVLLKNIKTKKEEIVREVLIPELVIRDSVSHI